MNNINALMILGNQKQCHASVNLSPLVSKPCVKIRRFAGLVVFLKVWKLSICKINKGRKMTILTIDIVVIMQTYLISKSNF